MKDLQTAVLLALLVLCMSYAEALKCNRCVASSVGGRCYTTVETCTRPEEVCASAVSSGPVYSYFKRCMKASDAFILNSTRYYQVFTCSTDRCN